MSGEKVVSEASDQILRTIAAVLGGGTVTETWLQDMLDIAQAQLDADLMAPTWGTTWPS